MNYLKLALLLSLPFTMQTTWSAGHLNLGEQNEKVQKILETIDGHIGFNGNTVHIMVDVAKKLKRFLNDRIYTFNGRTDHNILDLIEIESHHKGNADLDTILVNAKQDFENLVAQFISQASGTKGFLVILISESCLRRHRQNSLLLAWASAPEGHETVLFHNEIVTFKGLSLFCEDLTNFLGDLIESCPIAKAQFKQKLKDK